MCTKRYILKPIDTNNIKNIKNTINICDISYDKVKSLLFVLDYPYIVNAHYKYMFADNAIAVIKHAYKITYGIEFYGKSSINTNILYPEDYLTSEVLNYSYYRKRESSNTYVDNENKSVAWIMLFEHAIISSDTNILKLLFEQSYLTYLMENGELKCQKDIINILLEHPVSSLAISHINKYIDSISKNKIINAFWQRIKILLLIGLPSDVVYYIALS